MHRFIDCMTTEHDWRFVVGALVLCVAGLATTVALMSLARSAARRRRAVYGLGAAMVAALSVWATHFLAMIGYRAGGPVLYDISLTLLSLVIVCVGFAASMAFSLTGRGPLRRSICGMTAASAVAAMHFVGLSAVTLTGARMVLDPTTVAGAIALSLGFASLTGFMNRVPRRLRLPVATALGAATVVSLHFGSMSAITLMPSPTAIASDGMSQTGLLICLLVVVTVVVIITAFVTGVAYLSRSNTLAQLREAIDAMPDGLGFYDANDRLVVWNARYAEVNPEIASVLTSGMSFEQMVRIGLDMDLYVEAEGRKEEWLAERLLARQGLSSNLEQHVVGDHWLRVQDRRTSAGGTVTVVNDITDLKRDARALAEARDAADAANRAKSAFLANMSHEIRTPLNGVIGLAQALARTDLTAEQTEMLDLIQSSGQTLQTLLSDILDLARVESGRLEIASEPYGLSRAVQEAAQLYAASAAEKGLQFFVDIEPEADVWAMGDVVRVKQILTNLVSNAVKFTSQGFVSLTATSGTAADGESFLRFTVEDTGVGFDAEARDRLFTRFEQADGTITRRFGGTGLGLAICRQLAEMMHGNLDCESELGGGSAFILTLPLIRTEEPAAPVALEQSAETENEGARVRVLLADDHPTNRRVVELILSQANVQLTSVENGAEAFAAFRAQPFDLVLMDMQMPVMDGLAATREIRKHEAATGSDRTALVMLTANALAEHIAAGQAAGADRHLSKPFSAEALLGLVADLAPQSDALAA
ncbi:hypothetical protein BH09PSE1_BH09PSE1_23560 [soil metagenome]